MLPLDFKPPLSVMTLAEQVVAAELAYYRQLEQCVVTEADLTTWNYKQVSHQAVRGPLASWVSPAFARHVLERHHYWLPVYMAHQLSAEAWKYWFLEGSLVASFR